MSKCSDKTFSSRITYSFKSYKWRQIADLNVPIYCADSTVFKGKVVLTEGYNNWDQLKLVESFDYYENN